jgi:ABC-2 family transporter
MSSAWRTIAATQARDLLRRRAAILLLAGLPMTWYLAEAAAGVDYAVGTGVLAMAWSAAAAPLFAFLGARHVDQRLVQAGYKPRDIVAGRIAALLSTSLLLAAIFGTVMVVGSQPPRPADVFLALLLTTLVSTSIGWLTSSIVPRELEGTLVLIGLVGLQISIPVSGTADLLIPYFGPLRITDYSRSPTAPTGPTIHAVLWSIAIACVALALWKRRVRIQPPTPVAEFHPVRAPTMGDVAPARTDRAQA